MEAKDFTEKIYLNKYLLRKGMMYKAQEPDAPEIEYTRTDVFIEKACEWIRTHRDADFFELIPDYNYCGAGNLNIDKMIEEFVKAMKR